MDGVSVGGVHVAHVSSRVHTTGDGESPIVIHHALIGPVKHTHEATTFQLQEGRGYEEGGASF